jgi:hypothetical protein
VPAGGEPGVDSSVSNVLLGDIIIIILTIKASPDIGARLRLGKPVIEICCHTGPGKIPYQSTATTAADA